MRSLEQKKSYNWFLFRMTIVIAPLTKYSSENGLNIDSITKCEQVRAIAKPRLSNKLGKVNTQDMKQIDRALKIVLSLK